ncbi:MAG: hypothetical protein EPO30_02040 [Lysobacteraceae bacterium]|nr:MAG: hypothetical protein EPO30_02040 [Xanthomonadaceae bacterium]
MNRFGTIVPLALLCAFAAGAHADTLLVERVEQSDTAALPAHGLSMAQVQARFGAPSARLEPRGGQKAAWPVIHRWTYPAFTVYFEKDKVIDAVQNPLPGEGPVPAR